MNGAFRKLNDDVTITIVSSAAVVRVVTRGESLRDDPNNGCDGDYDNHGIFLPEFSSNTNPQNDLRLFRFQFFLA